jgi:hypothetical protein
MARKYETKVARRRFLTSADVSQFFKKRPRWLIDYVESCLLVGTWSYSTHITELSKLVGMPLKRGEVVFDELPEAFIWPGNFTNIDEIIRRGRHLFGGYILGGYGEHLMVQRVEIRLPH